MPRRLPAGRGGRRGMTLLDIFQTVLGIMIIIIGIGLAGALVCLFYGIVINLFD
jgi:hypothetical protein